MSTSLIDLWPSSANCLDCLTTEAESASNAVFLAVHQSMPLSRRLFSSSEQDAEVVTEKDMLDAFLSDNLPSGTLLLPIVGSSGVGKSHMIRWLDAHVRARQDGVRRHVVRIPKSASLKVVLSLILSGLTSESDAYGKLHDELSSASMPKELDDATYGLLSKLVVALERNHKEVLQRRESGSEKEDDHKRLTHCNPRCLPSLLRDPALTAHFTAHDKSGKLGVLARIASRYIQGDSAEDGPQNVFTPEDLKFGEDVSLGEVSAPVRMYLNVLKQKNGEHLSDAVSFLNEVVDQALGELLDFGGNSLTDLFVQIREQLLVDGIELVLLVEDFAALAGIQFSLLDAVIREGIRDGNKVLCTMRTALAVTEGYLSSRDTVMTRAQYEWRISDFPFSNEQEAVATYSDFVGGYLNASRWGKPVIEDRYANIQSSSVDDWLPRYYEDVREELAEQDNELVTAFGFSASGVALFPFNIGVIRQLVRSYFKKGEQYEFNPRRLINLVLRDTLVNHRRDFEMGVFPPPKFQDFDRNHAELNVLDEIKRKFLPNERTRAEAFVFYWGDNPQTLGQAASIDPLLFQCFKLSKIDWSARPESREVVDPVTVVNAGAGVVTTEATQEGLNIGNWKRKIDEWRRDGTLKSGDATVIRGYLAEALGEYVDWNSLTLEKPIVEKTKIFLPNVSIGNPNHDDAIAFASRNEDLESTELSDQFFRAMVAVIRYHEYKSWNYDGSEGDYVSYINLIDRMASEAVSYYQRYAHRVERSAVSVIAQSLLIGARILDVDGGSAKADSDNVASIYRLENEPANITEGKWGDLVSSASNIRNDLIELLSKFTAARQGDSKKKILAVDASFLLRVIRENRSTWKLPPTFDTKLFRDLPQIRDHLRTLKSSIDKSIQERGAYFSSWKNDVYEWLGDDFDVQKVQSTLLDLLSSSHKEQMFVCSEYSYDQLRALVRSLTECKIKDNLSKISTALESNDFGQQLSAVSKVDEQTIQQTRKIFSAYEACLTQTTAKVDERLATVPPSVDTVASKCLNQLESIDAMLNKLEGDNS